MPEALELPSLTAAAARAAREDDIPRAATLLRQAVELQTSTLGPEHPDVATTLNNLALMLEKLGHVKEAGQCYRRAHAIAAAALGPDDPVVQVSRANLDAFRATYAQPDTDDSAPLDPAVWGDLGDFPVGGTAPASTQPSGAAPVNEPAAAANDALTGVNQFVVATKQPVDPVNQPGAAANQPIVAAPPPPMSLQGKPRPAPPRAKPPEPAPDLPLQFAPTTVKVPVSHPAGRYPSSARRSSRAIVIGYLMIGAVLAALTAWWSSRPATPIEPGGPSEIATRSEAPATPAPPPPEAVPAPSAASPTRENAAAESPSPSSAPPGRGNSPAAGPPAGAPAAPAPSPVASSEVPAASTPRSTTGGAVGVTDARLCSSLTRTRNPWACAAVTSPVAGGPVYYYTRVRASRDMTIRHRWTLDGRVVQDVRLRIRANPAEGFRTFSRQTVSGLGAGTWVATLLGPDGERLDEKTFEVR